MRTTLKWVREILKGQKEKPLSDRVIKRMVHQPDRKCGDMEPMPVQIEKEE